METKNSYPEDLSYTVLEDQLRREMILGEKFRLFILAIVLAVLLIISSFVYLLYQEELDDILKSNVFIWIVILLGVLLLRSYNIQKIIAYRLKKGKTFNPIYFITILCALCV